MSLYTRAAAALLIVGVFLFASCVTSTDDASVSGGDRNVPSVLTPEPESSAPGAEGDPGLREFVVALPAGRLELNPIKSYTATEAQIFTAIYEGLVSYHPLDLEPLPAVAERWEVSPDGRTYTFYLRPEARYWNGDAVTATHFRDTWLTLINPSTAAAYNFLFDVIDGARDFRNGTNSDPNSVGIRVVNERVLEVRLFESAVHFLKILCHHSFMPVHPVMRAQAEWPADQPIIGNGPYFITARDEATWVLRRNELYWAAREVKIETLRFRFFEDDDPTLMREFNGGQIHWVTTGGRLNEVQFPQQIVINPLFATNYLFMNASTGPFRDPRVRRALALLVPWQRVRDPEVLYIPATTLVPRIPFYPEVEGITRADSTEALQLLEEAGYSRGVRLPALQIFLPAGGETQRVAGILKEAWESALQVTVEVRFVPYPGYFESLKREEYTVGMVGWIGDFADPLTFLQMWLTGSNVNDAGFNDPEYDALIDAAMSAVGQERYAIMARAEQRLLQSGTVMPMSHSPAINLIDLTLVDGWFPNPLDIHPYRYIRFSDFSLPPGAVRWQRRFDLGAPNWYTANDESGR